MNSVVLLTIFRFIALLTIQIFIFNSFNFLGFLSPYPYVLFILLYPVNGNKSSLLIASFLLGICMDMFSNSPGFHTTACVVLAFYRTHFFKLAFGLSYEYQTVKINDVLTPERFTFILLSIVLHHSVLFTLEAFKISLILDIILRIIFSSIFTIFICILIIYLTKPNKR